MAVMGWTTENYLMRLSQKTSLHNMWDPHEVPLPEPHTGYNDNYNGK